MSKKAILGWLSLGTIVATIVFGPMLVAAASPGAANQTNSANGKGANGNAGNQAFSFAMMAAKASNAVSSLSSTVSSLAAGPSNNAASNEAASVNGQVRRVGTVIAYTPGVSITIQDRKGNTYDFILASPLKILPASRASSLCVGAYVTVIAPANDPNFKAVAVGIVVHRGAPSCGTITPTFTPTSTPTNTATNTPTNTPTPSNTPTNTPTSTPTNTPTNTPTPTNTATNTPTFTATNTATDTPTSTPTFTPTSVTPPPSLEPLIPAEKPSIADPAVWSPDRPLSTIVAYTLPKDVVNWTIPLQAAAFADISAPPPGSNFTPVGIIQTGLTLTTTIDQNGSTSSCAPASKKGNGSQSEHVGVVVVYNTVKNVIVIAGRDGGMTVFDLASPLKIVPSARSGKLAVGAFVTVIAPANEPNNKHTAVGIVVHNGAPGCFPIPTYIRYNVWVDVVSTTDQVLGALEINGSVVQDEIFNRIEQIDNPERDPDVTPYVKFGQLGDPPSSAATISSDSVCFVVNDDTVVATSATGIVRFCTVGPAPAESTVTLGISPLARLAFPFSIAALQTTTTDPASVISSFPTQYASLQATMDTVKTSLSTDTSVVPTPVISASLPLDPSLVLSTIEDAARITSCANAQTNTPTDTAAIQAACASDIILEPVTRDYFQSQYEALTLPGQITVAIIDVLQDITVPTVNPAGSVTIKPGYYRVDYHFDAGGVFVASTVTGFAIDPTTSAKTFVDGVQAPAIPATFIDPVDTAPAGVVPPVPPTTTQPFAQITSMKIRRWCLLEGGCR